MRAAAALAAYALAIAWCAPVPLARLTARGASARLGLATWLAVMTSALVSAGLALAFLIRTLRAGWPHLTLAVCQEVAGSACTPVIYRSALYELGLAALVAIATLASLSAAWRCGRKVQRARRQTAEHGHAVRIVGSRLPGTGAVILEDSRPAAYCAAGTIVVTRGTLGVLDGEQLAAVLAHERAHLSGRHHPIALAVRGLAATFPGVPLFDRGLDEVTRLSEMCADDAAVRAEQGRQAVLAAALVAIATGRAVPGGGLMPRTALAAAAYAVQVRVERMLRPASTVRRSVTSALLAVALGLVILVPGVLAVLALPPWPRLASPGLAAAGPRTPGPRTRRKGAHAHSRAATDSPIPATATQAPVSVNFRSGTGTPVATHRS